jgi:hypothetical protein
MQSSACCKHHCTCTYMKINVVPNNYSHTCTSLLYFHLRASMQIIAVLSTTAIPENLCCTLDSHLCISLMYVLIHSLYYMSIPANHCSTFNYSRTCKSLLCTTNTVQQYLQIAFVRTYSLVASMQIIAVHAQQ